MQLEDKARQTTFFLKKKYIYPSEQLAKGYDWISFVNKAEMRTRRVVFLKREVLFHTGFISGKSCGLKDSEMRAAKPSPHSMVQAQKCSSEVPGL